MSNKPRIITDDPHADRIIDAVRERSKEVNVSAIARKIGVSRNTVYRWMCKGGDPRVRSLSQLIQALGMEFTAKAVTVDEQSP